MDFGDFKWENEEDKSDYKWEIINFFKNYYLIDQKEIDRRVKKIDMPKTIQEKSDLLYLIFLENDKCPADIADFLIRVGDVFKVNAEKRAIDKIKEFRKDSHSLKEWVTFFKENFLKF
jgi:hypothetical protein